GTRAAGAAGGRGGGPGARRSDLITLSIRPAAPRASPPGWTSPEARAQAFGPPVAQHSPVVDSTRTPVVRRVESLVYLPPPRIVKAGGSLVDSSSSIRYPAFPSCGRRRSGSPGGERAAAAARAHRPAGLGQEHRDPSAARP